MKNYSLLRIAVGDEYGDYYMGVFEHIERGFFWGAAWNWWAFILGPLWMLYRRIEGLLPLLHIFNYLFFQVLIFESDLGWGRYGLMVAVQSVFFAIPANFIYYRQVSKYINEISSGEDAESIVRNRFQTTQKRAGF